ncbi:MAG: SDR family oxidoreductase [Actinomycetia bacterium]|nr:SDR family oxidoreductase [Actinomycetes bacterium]
MTVGVLQDKVALVLGGTYGIGRAVARRFAEEGAHVVATGRRPRPELEAEATAAGLDLSVQVGDMTVWDDVRRVVEATHARHARLDVVVVAGKPERPAADLFLETDPATFPDYFVGRTVSRFYAARAAAPLMKAQGKGKILFLTTDAGRTPTPAEVLIGASAAAVIFGTRALARELARFGIRVNTIALSLTQDTPIFAEYQRQKQSGAVIWKAFEKIERTAPFGLNRPEDVANVAAFLASDAADQVSGATISLNGGIAFPG